MREIELLNPADTGGRVEEIARRAALDARSAWDELVSSEPAEMIQARADGLAASAWDNVQTIAGDDALETGRNVAYLGGRGAIGTAAFFEGAVETGSVWANSALGRRDAAEDELRHSISGDLADDWTDFMGVGEDMERLGDGAGSAGEAVGAIAATAAAASSLAAGSVPIGVGVAATGVASLGVAGQSLDESFEKDGALTDEALGKSALSAVATAAAVAVPGAIARHASKAEIASGATSSSVSGEGQLAPGETVVVDGAKTYGDDAGRVFRTEDDLVPNLEYEINGYKYKTDSLGRIESASGNLQIKDHSGRLKINDTLSSIGKGFEREGDQKGHLIADRFNGSSGLENIVAQNADVNTKTVKAIEDKCADALKDGCEVFYKVEPRYSGNSYRPNSFRVTDIIDGKKTVTTIKNLSGGTQ